MVSGVSGTTANGSFLITVVDSDHFELDGTDGSAEAFTFDSATVTRTLRTAHLAPNPVVTEFLKLVYAETADMMAAARSWPRR